MPGHSLSTLEPLRRELQRVELGLYRNSSWSPWIRIGRLHHQSVLSGRFLREFSARVRSLCHSGRALTREVIRRVMCPVLTSRDRMLDGICSHAQTERRAL